MTLRDKPDTTPGQRIEVKPGDRFNVVLDDRTLEFEVLLSEGQPEFVEILDPQANLQTAILTGLRTNLTGLRTNLEEGIREKLWKSLEAMVAVKPMMMIAQKFDSPEHLRNSIERLSILSADVKKSMGTNEKPIFMLGVKKGDKSQAATLMEESFEELAKELESHDISAHLTSF